MKLLVIGCGSIGRRHAMNASKLAETAVFDEVDEVRKGCAAELGIKDFNSIDGALKWKPQGVIVATPTNTHVSIANKVIESGADVLIEKPISDKLQDAQKLVEKAKVLKKKISVVCNMRFHPGVATLHKNLNRIGRPLFARAHVGNYLPNMRPNIDYRKLYCSDSSGGGGLILDAIHEIDYLFLFFGPVTRIICSSEKLGDLEIDVEDYAELILRHSNNVFSSIHMDYLRHFKRRGCEIVGDKGMLLWQSEGKSPEKCSVRYFHKDGREWHDLFVSESLDTNRPYIRLLKGFLQAIDGIENMILDGITAVKELEVALGSLESKESGSVKEIL